jgi:hypothetical protein
MAILPGRFALHLHGLLGLGTSEWRGATIEGCQSLAELCQGIAAERAQCDTRREYFEMASMYGGVSSPNIVPT